MKRVDCKVNPFLMNDQFYTTLTALAFYLLCLSPVSGQQAVVLPASLQAMGSGGVSLRWPEVVLLNPASGTSAGFSAGINYANHFLLNDLSAASAYSIFPVAGSRGLLNFSRFGNIAYRENQFSLGLAKQLDRCFSGGVQFHYLNLVMAENENHPALLTFSLGAQYYTARFGMGVSCFNPLGQSLRSGDFRKPCPAHVCLGVHRIFQETLTATGQLSYNESEKLNTHWGLSYQVGQRFFLRAGLQTDQPEWSFGMGWSMDRLQADLAFSYHEFLGFSPSFSLYLRKV